MYSSPPTVANGPDSRGTNVSAQATSSENKANAAVCEDTADTRSTGVPKPVGAPSMPVPAAAPPAIQSPAIAPRHGPRSPASARPSRRSAGSGPRARRGVARPASLSSMRPRPFSRLSFSMNLFNDSIIMPASDANLRPSSGTASETPAFACAVSFCRQPPPPMSPSHLQYGTQATVSSSTARP